MTWDDFAMMMLERDEALAKLAASEARCEQLTGELAELDTALNRTHSVIIEPLERTLSTLRAKYDLMVAEMAKDGEVADPRDAVVEAAKYVVRLHHHPMGEQHAGNAMAAMMLALDNLEDASSPSQPEPAGEREIMVGSTWRRRPGRSHAGVEHKVTGRSANGWVKTEAVDRYEPSIWNPTRWHEQLEWVSDPPAVIESAAGEEPKG